MSARNDDAIWHVPLLIIAGLVAIAGITVSVAVWRAAIPEPWGTGLQWGLAGASLTFTIARIIHARRVGRRELELLVVGGGILIAHYFVIAAAAVVVIAVILLILDEL